MERKAEARAAKQLFVMRPEDADDKTNYKIFYELTFKSMFQRDMEKIDSIEACQRNLEQIKKADVVYLWWKKGDDAMLFCVGMAFGLGKHMQLINVGEVAEEEFNAPGKSFGKVLLKMQYETRVPNTERNDEMAKKVKEPNDAFLICKVRGASKEVLEDNQAYVSAYSLFGKKMYYPPVDTDQSDTNGFNICWENRQGIRNSKEVHVKLDKDSKGSVFDLGMAFALGKNIVLVNEPEVREWESKSPDWSYGKLLLWLDSERRKSVAELKRQA
jgi:hypothetical protein